MLPDANSPSDKYQYSELNSSNSNQESYKDFMHQSHSYKDFMHQSHSYKDFIHRIHNRPTSYNFLTRWIRNQKTKLDLELQFKV